LIYFRIKSIFAKNKTQQMKLAIVGATGLVGQEVIRVIPEFLDTKDLEIIPVASARSVGRKIDSCGKSWLVVSLEEAIAQCPDMAIFAVGATVSRQYAPLFVAAGTTVVDNSSAWRMDPSIPLIVPEINASVLTKEHQLISNPNCSTIQLVMVLAPLQKKYGIKRIVVATYQSVSGTGQKAVKQLLDERMNVMGEKIYPHPIDLNLFPFAGTLLDNDYTDEEMKLVNETQKILDTPKMAITVTIARVPVLRSHSEAVNIEFFNEYNTEEVRSILQQTLGIVVYDVPAQHQYPTPLLAQGKNEIFVGRIRRDESQPKTLNLWIVADNLRKGAATNAVQIIKYLIDKNLK
jgi:aspartate-semialdehyde dehydrogenase